MTVESEDELNSLEAQLNERSLLLSLDFEDVELNVLSLCRRHRYIIRELGPLPMMWGRGWSPQILGLIL